MIDTDILTEHLIFSGSGSSLLEGLMMRGVCFTTVINASELFLTAETEEHIMAVKDVLSALKVLGLHSRYSLSINEYRSPSFGLRDAMFITAAALNKLPIVTLNTAKYKNAKVQIFQPTELISAG